MLRAWKAPTGQTSLAHRHECARSPRTARRANPSTHKEWKGSRTPTPSSARRGGSSRVRARCPGHPAGRGAWVARGQAEPEQEAVPRGAGPGQGRGGGSGPGWPAWLRGRKCSKWGHRNTGPRADMAVASATADVGQQTVTRSPEVQEPGRLTETDGPTALGGGALPAERQLTCTALRTSVCQMGAKVTIVAADIHRQVTGPPLPSTSSQDTGMASHVSRDKSRSSSLTAGGGETRQTPSQLEVQVNLIGHETHGQPRTQALASAWGPGKPTRGLPCDQTSAPQSPPCPIGTSSVPRVAPGSGTHGTHGPRRRRTSTCGMLGE